MSALAVTRLRDLFLTPDSTPAQQVAERAIPATLGVLAGPADALVAGAALALAAASAHHAGCAVLCRWDGSPTDAPPRAGLAVAPARRLAQRLSHRGLAAAACGRLVTVALPALDTEARAAAERTLAAIGDLPLILVIAGPRPPALDPLLATLDRLIVVPSTDAPLGLERLAIDAAARLGRGTAVLRLPDDSSTTGRLLAATGLPLSPRLRAAARRALEGGDA